MKFESQICTTREQSERLLALGLKKETADMVWSGLSEWPICHPYNRIKHLASDLDDKILPAWSLHRLIEMIPSFINIGEHTYIFRIIQGKLFSYHNNIVGDVLLYGKGSIYNSAIYTIEWLIGEGYFNKEYLEE
jgi:hypothetical protein